MGLIDNKKLIVLMKTVVCRNNNVDFFFIAVDNCLEWGINDKFNEGNFFYKISYDQIYSNWSLTINDIPMSEKWGISFNLFDTFVSDVLMPFFKQFSSQMFRCYFFPYIFVPSIVLISYICANRWVKSHRMLFL